MSTPPTQTDCKAMSPSIDSIEIDALGAIIDSLQQLTKAIEQQTAMQERIGDEISNAICGVNMAIQVLMGGMQ